MNLLQVARIALQMPPSNNPIGDLIDELVDVHGMDPGDAIKAYDKAHRKHLTLIWCLDTATWGLLANGVTVNGLVGRDKCPDGPV